ncbi:MAG: hypothetical protein BGO51_13710 [Rhodospirillales bacterium 69-11]|nr:hypothetical protein [Rhodospirillales bacterium]OJW26386.1 MAG: hypothetical protein BGO51_13710 [Rhodospirillales bacterium 69-11]
MARSKADPKRHSLVWLQGLACGALAALVPSLAVMIGILLGPGLVMLVLDQEPTKPVARAVLLCGVATVVDPIRALWSAGHGLDASLALAGDLRVVGTAWSAAAAGWLLAELAPVVVRAVLEAGGLARAAQLRAARARLAEEWGLPDAEE